MRRLRHAFAAVLIPCGKGFEGIESLLRQNESLANPWKNISRRRQKTFECPETPPMNLAGKCLPGARDAGPLDKVLRTSLAVADVDPGEIEEVAEAVRMHRFDNDDIDRQTANDGPLRIHENLHNSLKT